MPSLVPEPHPLDFDWRYTTETIDRLVAELPSDADCIAIGAPTVAAAIDQRSGQVLLVDRQPIQRIANCLCIDVRVHAPLSRKFSHAVVDPPWYPDDFKRWISWAAQSLLPGATILTSLWPQTTR